MSKRNDKNKEYIKVIIENYVGRPPQKYIPFREQCREYMKQLMREIEDDLNTIEDLTEEIKLITDPLKRREKSDCRRYLLEVCKEKARIALECKKLIYSVF